MSWRLEGANGVPPERLEEWQRDLQEASASSSLVLALSTQDCELISVSPDAWQCCRACK